MYFVFSVTEEFQTLPPVLKVKVLHQYQDSSRYAGRTVYNVGTTGILYDQLSPYIMKHENVEINSTWATLRLFTRHPVTVYYILRERGNNLSELTPSSLRTHPEAVSIQTYRNNSNYVNAYCLLTLKRLEHQTIYYLYAMAHSSLGDSK